MSLDFVGLVRGALTAVLFGAFVALWIWSWNSKRKPAFDAAARSPLDDDDASAEPPQR